MVSSIGSVIAAVGLSLSGDSVMTGDPFGPCCTRTLPSVTVLSKFNVGVAVDGEVATDNEGVKLSTVTMLGAVGLADTVGDTDA